MQSYQNDLDLFNAINIFSKIMITLTTSKCENVFAEKMIRMGF